MANILYAIAVALLIIWAIAHFGYHSEGIINVLIVFALIAIMVRVLLKQKA